PLDQRVIPETDRVHERRALAKVGRLDVGTRIEHQSREVGVALRERVVKQRTSPDDGARVIEHALLFESRDESAQSVHVTGAYGGDGLLENRSLGWAELGDGAPALPGSHDEPILRGRPGRGRSPVLRQNNGKAPREGRLSRRLRIDRGAGI